MIEARRGAIATGKAGGERRTAAVGFVAVAEAQDEEDAEQVVLID